jgi:hypothetical protein
VNVRNGVQERYERKRETKETRKIRRLATELSGRKKELSVAYYTESGRSGTKLRSDVNVDGSSKKSVKACHAERTGKTLKARLTRKARRIDVYCS